jgi:hypothetical protein
VQPAQPRRAGCTTAILGTRSRGTLTPFDGRPPNTYAFMNLFAPWVAAWIAALRGYPGSLLRHRRPLARIPLGYRRSSWMPSRRVHDSDENRMWRQLKNQWNEFRNDPPGERFQNSYERQRKRLRSPIARYLTPVLGALLVVAGLILGLIPGVPGIVLVGIGIALIATRFRRMSLWLDWMEVRLRGAWRRIRRGKTPRQTP